MVVYIMVLIDVMGGDNGLGMVLDGLVYSYD